MEISFKTVHTRKDSSEDVSIQPVGMATVLEDFPDIACFVLSFRGYDHSSVTNIFITKARMLWSGKH